MMTLNMGNVERKDGSMMLVGNARQYRADCKVGLFKIGNAHYLDKTLKFEPISAKVVNEHLFKYKFQTWVEILFVDENGLVSSILFKGESLDNFMELYRQAIVNNRNMTTTQIQAKMSERSGEHGKFYAVEFEILGDGKYTADIESFAECLPIGIFRLDALTGDNGGNGNNGNGNGSAEDEETTAIATVPKTYTLKKQR